MRTEIDIIKSPSKSLLRKSRGPNANILQLGRLQLIAHVGRAKIPRQSGSESALISLHLPDFGSPSTINHVYVEIIEPI